jgi:hypothetical protein
MKQGQVLGGKI